MITFNINKLRKILLFIIFYSFFINNIFSIENKISKNDYLQVYGFAESLFQEKDYYRSMTEFQRSAFITNNTLLKQIGYLKSAESLYLGNNKSLDLISFQKINHPILLPYKISMFAFANFYNNNLKLSENYFNQLKNIDNTNNASIEYQLLLLKLKNNLLSNHSFFQEESTSAEKNKLIHFSTNMLLAKKLYFSYPNQINLKNKIHDLFNKENLNTKSLFLGAFLSTIIPGAGQVYAGKWGDGIISFLFVSFLSSVSIIGYNMQEQIITTTFASLAGVFYLGNIYGGYNAVRNYNILKQTNLIEKINQISLKYKYYLIK